MKPLCVSDQLIIKFATIFGSLSLIAVTVQAYFLFKQIKAEHEKARREKAVDLLVQWSKELNLKICMKISQKMQIVKKFA